MKIPNLSEIPDLTPVPPGEYDIQIVKAEMKQNKDKDRTGLMLTCKILNEENTLPVRHNIWFGNTTDDEEKAEGMNRRAKQFIESVGLDAAGETEAEDFVNLEFTALLKVAADFFDGTDVNEISRVV